MRLKKVWDTYGKDAFELEILDKIEKRKHRVFENIMRILMH